MWFAAMGNPQEYPWTLHLVWKLLHNNLGALRPAGVPTLFPDQPPSYIRAVLYEYKFAAPGNPNHAWWIRSKLGLWLPPLSAGDPALIAFLRQEGWLPAADGTAPARR